ncbi:MULTISPECIES: type II toxin-antitoxin system Phd/YefM family antitoxin [Gordonia]|uniref:Uncharacterized protein n=2 Tax=Gordonia TaxID=2053 RepID=L7LQD0_9ACTN|nr:MULTISPECIES: type II toxin-antitoxin system Phd/YefM family antitoxin [Gordonia]WFN95174.1 type II toxin-antitoxin system Phd/YefM family antitoxin [Gordonia sihwensis]GAC62382.1 hypothetical protein GSI01S_33_00680 [Gordonia sihwensis NBRC 108236]
METRSITEVRAELPALVRALDADPAAEIGITVNGRLVASVVSAHRRPDASFHGWIDTGGHVYSQLTESMKACGLLTVDNRGQARIWRHAVSGAQLAVAPSGNWDEWGTPRVTYWHPATPAELMEIRSWHLGQWDGSSSADYGNILDDAERQLAKRIAETGSGA